MDKIIEKAARIAHGINRVYCIAIGDDSQVSWDEAPDWQKDSARNGAKFVLEHHEVTPEQSHINWLKQKQHEGWKYGPVKDAEKKEHPCCVPYSELPAEQKAKDVIFSAVVHGILAHHEKL